jgi:hypothetical protein
MNMNQLINTVVPEHKILSRSEDVSPELDNYKCRRMLEQYVKDFLPDTTSLVIMWIDKNNMLSTAYCNVSPLKRLELYVVGWLQELFDIKVKDGKK